MPSLWMDVDAALSEVPVNAMPLIDDGDFKSVESSVAYNAAGLALVWNFVTTAGAYTQTAVTPTSGGSYDWTNEGNGMYAIEIPASGGASINNDAEGFGWFTGVATGVLPWAGPTIGFRAAALNNSLVDAGTTGVLAPTVADRTLDVTATGGAGIDWGNVENPSASVNLSATTTNVVNTASAVGTGGITFASYGKGAAPMVHTTTIATLSSQTSFTLTAGSADNSAYNRCQVLVIDSSTATQVAVGYISAYTGSSRTVTLVRDPGIFTMAVGDTVVIFPTVADAVWDEVLTGSTHNVSTSAGQRLRQLAGSIVESNTAQAGGTASITLATAASSTDGIYDPSVIRIVSGTGAGQARMCIQYVGSTRVASVDRDWRIVPDNTSVYEIVASPNLISTNEGLLTGATSTTATLNANASAVDGSYVGQTLVLRTGTGQDQSRVITGYVGATKVATLATAWNTTPAAGTGYMTWPLGRSMVTDVEPSALAEFFTVNSGKTFADAVAGSVVKEIADNSGGGSAPTVQQIVDGVWDEPIIDHLDSGSTGAALNAAGSAGDPWTTPLPGAYGAGTAGHIIGTAIPDIAPGSANGLLLAGSNAATTFATLTSTGAFTINGTSNVAQTGDSFARIGATGSGLTSLAPSATALSTAQWTNARAGYLDNINNANLATVPAFPSNFASLSIDASGRVVLQPSQTGVTFSSLTVSGTTTLTGAVTLSSTLGVSGAITATNASNNITGVTASLGTGAITDTAIATSGANRLADTTLRRSQANVEASSYGDSLTLFSQYGFVQQAQESTTTASANTLTVYRTDGTTILGTRTITTDGSSEPVVSVE